MYSNYSLGLGSRSKSTMDVFRASNLDNEPSSSSISCVTTLSRTARSRRPALPDNSNRDATKNAASLKRAKSYLSVEIRREFESTAAALKQQPSTRSNTFVKKLVATLERRQREQGAMPADNEFYKRSYLKYKDPNNGNALADDTTERPRERSSHIADAEPFQTNDDFYRLPRIKLKDLHKRENVYIDDFSSDPEEEEKKEEEKKGEEAEEEEESDEFVSTFWKNDRSFIAPPIRSLNNDNFDSNDDDDNNNKNNNDKENVNNNGNPSKFSTRRTLKSMLSSLISWKYNKSLPKGTRDYYATRESLSDEMRAFRRDTMPRLMEHAVTKSRLDRTSKIESDGARKERREFSAIIGSLKIIDERPSPCIATIHPVYGNKATALRREKISRYRESLPAPPSSPPMPTNPHDKPEIIYGMRKAQPPAKSLRSNISPPKTEHLLRPSKIKVLQKRLSQELHPSSSYVVVQARTKQPSNDLTSIVYDVPRSNRRIVTSDAARTPPEYENIRGFINDDDKRLHCTAFTTF